MKWKPAQLSPMEFVAGLVVKVLMGFLYGSIYLHYYNGDDTWRFQEVSLQETALLLNDPCLFFINEFTPVHALTEGDGWKQVITLYLNDLQYAMVVKVLAIFNLVTGGNYYINSALFNLIFFWGHYWLFVLFTSLYPEKRKLFYLASFFFLPAVFWLSGVRIDGWLFFFLSLFILKLSQADARFRNALLILGFVGILVSRAEVAAIVLPALIGFGLSKKINPRLAYGSALLLCLLVFFGSSLVMQDGGLSGLVASKQHQFLQLEGTRLPLPRLDHRVHSYILAFPNAWSNTFIRPFPWETEGLLQLLASLEIIVFWTIAVITLLNLTKDWKSRLSHPVILFLLFVSVGVYVSVGYTVPFPGAIIRYKAPALLMMMMTMLCMIDPKRIKINSI